MDLKQILINITVSLISGILLFLVVGKKRKKSKFLDDFYAIIKALSRVILDSLIAFARAGAWAFGTLLIIIKKDKFLNFIKTLARFILDSLIICSKASSWGFGFLLFLVLYLTNSPIWLCFIILLLPVGSIFYFTSIFDKSKQRLGF